MAPTFDLLAEPWLAVRAGDEPQSASLRELFLRAHELSDVTITPPPAAAGLWRVLYVIATRVTGLDDPGLRGEAWLDRAEEAWSAGRFDPDRVNAYFDRYVDRFDLFHPQRPWLQDPRLAAECAKSSGINKLVPSRPAGNSQPWFLHVTDAQSLPVPTEEAVGHLMARLFFGPSGRCTTRSVNGTSAADTKAGPLRGTISFHPVGDTVFESLLAGLTPAIGEEGEEAKAPWETDEPANPLGVPKAVCGVAGLVTRFQHAVLLEAAPDGRSVTDVRLTWGLRAKHGPLQDPYLVYRISREGGVFPRSAEAGRALFRDLDALLCKDAGDPDLRRPQIMDMVTEAVPWEVVDRLRVRAFAFDQDGQTRDREWFTATTPPVLGLIEEREPAAAAAISRWRRAAELSGGNLRWALRRAWVAINDPSNGDGRAARPLSDIGEGPWLRQGVAAYWPRAERQFWQLVRAEDFTAESRSFLQHSLTAYDEVTGGHAHRPRTARAIERARGLLYRGYPNRQPSPE